MILIYSILISSKRSVRTALQNANIFIISKTHFQSSQKTLQKETISQVEFDKQTDIFYKKHAIYRKTK